jgi:hypothetical protein
MFFYSFASYLFISLSIYVQFYLCMKQKMTWGFFLFGWRSTITNENIRDGDPLH